MAQGHLSPQPSLSVINSLYLVRRSGLFSVLLRKQLFRAETGSKKRNFFSAIAVDVERFNGSLGMVGAQLAALKG